MKTLHLKSHRQFRVRGLWYFAGVLIIAALWGGVVTGAEEGNAERSVAEPAAVPTNPQATSEPEAAPAQANQNDASNQPGAEQLSPVVVSIIKLADAKVSTAVIKTYIECTPSAGLLTEADIIALKQHNVADEIVTAMLHQGAQKQAQVAQQRNEALASVLAARQARSGGLDPESYDYFRYYYLQPRAMASAYQRLYPNYGSWSPYRYGSFPAYGFRLPSYGPLGY